MSVKPYYIRFEGLDDEKPLMRHVGRIPTKPSDTIRVMKVVNFEDVKPLLEAVSKHLKDPASVHSLEILRSRISYWKAILLGLNERSL